MRKSERKDICILTRQISSGNLPTEIKRTTRLINKIKSGQPKSLNHTGYFHRKSGKVTLTFPDFSRHFFTEKAKRDGCVMDS